MLVREMHRPDRGVPKWQRHWRPWDDSKLIRVTSRSISSLSAHPLALQRQRALFSGAWSTIARGLSNRQAGVALLGLDNALLARNIYAVQELSNIFVPHMAGLHPQQSSLHAAYFAQPINACLASDCCQLACCSLWTGAILTSNADLDDISDC